MLTLFKYLKPRREKKIDVIHFFYSEFKIIVENRRNPTFAPYVQAFIIQATSSSIMIILSVAKHGPVQIVARWNTKLDPYHPTLCPGTKPKPNGSEAPSSSSQEAHGKGPADPHGPSMSYNAPKKKGFTYPDQKAMMSYIKAMHRRMHKSSARSKLALSLINKECHHNG